MELAPIRARLVLDPMETLVLNGAEKRRFHDDRAYVLMSKAKFTTFACSLHYITTSSHLELVPPIPVVVDLLLTGAGPPRLFEWGGIVVFVGEAPSIEELDTAVASTWSLCGGILSPTGTEPQEAPWSPPPQESPPVSL